LVFLAINRKISQPKNITDLPVSPKTPNNLQLPYPISSIQFPYLHIDKFILSHIQLHNLIVNLMWNHILSHSSSYFPYLSSFSFTHDADNCKNINPWNYLKWEKIIIFLLLRDTEMDVQRRWVRHNKSRKFQGFHSFW